ncbi:MAG: DoxX family protein [bacterium]
MTYLLWIIQILLALLFLFAGGTKLVIPPDVLEKMGSPNQVHLPGMLLRAIGVFEVLGGLGLILPGLLRIKPWLTPLAAVGLLIIMIGAVVISIMGDGFMAALPALVTGLLLAFVAYGRTRLAPQSERSKT